MAPRSVGFVTKRHPRWAALRLLGDTNAHDVLGVNMGEPE
jgi:hypothetical protein